MIGRKAEHVWRYFEQLSAIPRPSGMEKKAGDFVVKVAKEHSLPFKRDKVGNVLVQVPATKGMEKSPTVVLQGHLDMVCEKNAGTRHDFAKDPIKLKVEGDWLKAVGTTLGADNGIGVAMGLALLDDPAAKHGPLELLFTIDEERGLKGANSLTGDFLKGKMLINLDTEEEGAIYIGCAGGTDTVLSLRASREHAGKGKGFTLMVTGLRGGHSGSDINEGRGNANQILVRALRTMKEAGIAYRLHEISGGSKRNAIPREAFAKLSMDQAGSAEAAKAARKLTQQMRFELRGIDDNVTVALKEDKAPLQAPFTAKSAGKLLDFLFCVPHGVISYDREIPGLVETSTNFAIIESGEKKVEVVTSQRSSVMPRLYWAAERLRVLGSLAGARAKSSGTYHGWAPNLSSPLLLQAKKTYKRMTGKEPCAKAIHAGLECGILGEKFPGMDMISLGPTIRNAHSPDEMVSIASTERIYGFLKELLKDLAAKK